MLLNDFFKITDIQGEGKYTVTIELNAQHKIFKGHFPENPIVPGVCLMQMLQETVEQILIRKLILTDGDNLKFTAVLNPEENPEVNMSISLKDKEEGKVYVDGIVFKGETTFFSFKGSFN